MRHALSSLNTGATDLGPALWGQRIANVFILELPRALPSATGCVWKADPRDGRGG